MDISVIIPCYNQGKYLVEAIDSVEKISASLLIEILIINDGSDDVETLEVLDRLLESGYRVINFNNRGVSSARNKGLELSTGKYIQFLDADDIIINNKFVRQLELFAHDPHLRVAVSDFLFAEENLSKTYRLPTHQAFFSGNHPLESFLFSWDRGFIIPIHCFLFKREVFYPQNERVMFDVNLASREDWFLWCKIALTNAKFKFDPEVMVIYRKHDVSSTKNVLKSLKGFLIAQIKVAGLINEPALRYKFIKYSIFRLFRTKHVIKLISYLFKNMCKRDRKIH
jgi:glycosyltransferase involved in cell wall biosynthesis